MYIPVLYLDVSFLHNKSISPRLISSYQYMKK